MASITIVWLRQDLRLDDHPALTAACRRGVVVPVFIWSADEEGAWRAGAASSYWLHLSLAALADSLQRRGARLVLRQGRALETLAALATEVGADAVYWTRRYEPAAVERDALVERRLQEAGLEVATFAATLIHEPGQIATRQGTPFKVFTPFYKHCQSLGPPPPPLAVPARIAGPGIPPSSEPLERLGLEPRIDWAQGIRASWTPGADGASRELDVFVDAAIEHYGTDRDRPAVDGTSRLSPHLHFGEITPRRVWHTIAERFPGRGDGAVNARVEAYTRQLYWREFAYHLLYHFPHTTGAPLHEKFARFPWGRGGAALRAWQRGRTGYPLVDAGMRELWHTGWMHNRVRMNVASFLVKHLLTHWLEGARWFWDTLVDADLANNTLGWQWAAGCGADAAPYFRIFNPVAQGQRFDPHGLYVRRWLPELAALPDEYIHAPWTAPGPVLEDCGIALGETYPHPVVEHKAARAAALAALERIKAS